MPKRWNIKSPNPELQVQFSNELGIHPIVAQLLINRKIVTVAEAEVFLRSHLSRLHDPLLLKDMNVAIERIFKARDRQETVLIFGDYDVDGVTSSALLTTILRRLGVAVINYIPHRMHEGYGLNEGIGDYAKSKNVSLLISVDCGINAFSVVDSLNSKGIDVIVIDHHEPSEGRLPNAVAVVNPKRPDCLYPFKGLAAVGLVAKLCHALLGEFPEESLDLVLLGTVADVAELKGENRIFVKAGLPRINGTKNIGLLALMDVARIKDKKFRSHFVGFVLGPRINATGRMDSAQTSLDLLLCEDSTRAYELARSLEGFNADRQKMQQSIVQEAMDMIAAGGHHFNDGKVIVLHKEGWHKGVLGIVAARIVEKYYRPTIVLSVENGMATGSARSIEGFHLFEALTHCSDCLQNYGGHKMAAGLTVRTECIPDFRERINQFALENLKVENLTPTLNLDAEIPLSQLSLELVTTVEELEPFGEGNPTPVFCSRNLTVKTPPVVHGKDTLKFWVTDGKTAICAVGFGMGKYKELVTPGDRVDLAYSLDIDDWNKEPVVSLRLKDIKANGV